MRRPARVMMLIDTLAAGGAERLAVELACAFDPAEFRAHVVATKRGGPLESLLADAGVPYTILRRRRLFSVRTALAALRLARRSDLVHSHLFGNNVWGALIARAARVPLVAHEHNRVARHVPLESMIDRLLIAPAAARILCVSESNAGDLRAGGLRNGAIDVVPNGVAGRASLPRAAARRALGLDAADVVVGAVAALRPEKAHDVLLHAFRALLDEHRDLCLRLCLVGEGSCRAELRDLARRLRISERVVFAGERSDAPRLHRAFDVAVIPSRREGLPLAALESLAAGTPLVATRVGGLPEALADGAGLLVEPGDAAGLASAIATVLTRPEVAWRLAVEGRRRAASRFAFADTVEAVAETYRTVLADRTPSAFLARPAREDVGSGARVESLV